jgi:hypothetical protein
MTDTNENNGHLPSSRTFTGTNIASLLVLALLAGTFHPKVLRLFSDLGVSLPVFTRLLVSIPSGLYLVLFLILAVVTFVKDRMSFSPQAKLRANIATGVFCLATLLAYVVGILMPLRQVVGAVN